MSIVEEFDHESFRTAVGTVGGYGLILIAMFVALFVVPFLVFLVL